MMAVARKMQARRHFETPQAWVHKIEGRRAGERRGSTTVSVTLPAETGRLVCRVDWKASYVLETRDLSVPSKGPPRVRRLRMAGASVVR